MTLPRANCALHKPAAPCNTFEQKEKTILRHIEKTYTAPARHWVGDGFHVSPLFNHMQGDKYTSPFLMLDYAMPQHFAPNEAQSPKGVGAHRTPASRPSPSPCKVKSPTATAPATAAPSQPATCNG